jgi:hypothetical protein
MRPLLALSAVLVLAGCGGGESKEPLTLAQRVVLEEDAPGSKPDPVEKGQQTADFDEFIDALSELAIDPDRETMTGVFREAGFQEAIADARFFGETHSRTSPHIFSTAIQLQSAEGAAKALEWLHADSLKPCPKTCAVQISEFEVDGIPDARGVRRSQSAEDIEAVGRKDDLPFDSYEVLFSDGPFVYTVDVHGPPGSVTEEQVQEIASALHSRVEGAPPLAA